MKKDFKYVDGFLVPVPRKNLVAYKKLAKLFGKVWMEHGALDYVEAIADDVTKGEVTSFPRSVKLKAGEVVCYSFVTFRSRANRDAIAKKVMSDPRLIPFMNSDKMLFDGMRMMWGGFKPFVSLHR